MENSKESVASRQHLQSAPVVPQITNSVTQTLSDMHILVQLLKAKDKEEAWTSVTPNNGSLTYRAQRQP